MPTVDTGSPGLRSRAPVQASCSLPNPDQDLASPRGPSIFIGEHWLQGPLAGKAAAPGSLPWGHGGPVPGPVPWAVEFQGPSHLDWNPAAGEAFRALAGLSRGKRGHAHPAWSGRSGAPGAQVFLFWFWPLGVPASLQAFPAARPLTVLNRARPVLSGANTRCLVELLLVFEEAPGEAKGEWREASWRASHASELRPRA